jgi:hypothetical protein
LDESKKTTKPILDLSRCFHSTDESQIVLALSQSYSTRMRVKELTKMELAPSLVFLDLDESKKAAKPTLDLS